MRRSQISKHGVVVIGAGLAGLSCARDLVAGGADVIVLEARDRPGGRVVQTQLEDGRLVQLGGELTGSFQTAYRGLVEELGLTLEPAFPSVPGEDTYVLAEGRFVGDGFPWMTDEDRASYDRAEKAFRELADTVDPDDPWAHPEAERLDRLSVGAWMRDAGATPNAVRARELASLALSCESVERTSLLSDLRKEATAGGEGFYDYERWERDRVAEGSGTVPLRLAEEVGAARLRYATAVERISVGSSDCNVVARNGECFRCDAVVSALPVGPLRDVHVEGVSAERMASLRRQRHALAAKAVLVYPASFWEGQGQNGTLYSETGLIGGTWPQVDGVLSTLVPPERLAPLLATPAELTEAELTEEMAGGFGEGARLTQGFFLRRWGLDPWTQGYITSWRPGDVMAVGPLHGSHEPPFYVCGSDQWVCGYMEGAVRTGRAAAAAALAGR
ncbi:MAG: FAD-dependent oxidoreductase [Actinobacteria bacterium]|nr:FAD-dependent oxidoreductase [Actinomycetota bacterium]